MSSRRDKGPLDKDTLQRVYSKLREAKAIASRSDSGKLAAMGPGLKEAINVVRTLRVEADDQDAETNSWEAAEL